MEREVEPIFYPAVNECIFLRANATIAESVTLPEFITLDKGEQLLRFVYRYKTYTLGVTKDGWLAGFKGVLKPGKKAELLICRDPKAETFKVFDARFKDGKDISAEIVEEAEDLAISSGNPWIPDEKSGNWRAPVCEPEKKKADPFNWGTVNYNVS